MVTPEVRGQPAASSRVPVAGNPLPERLPDGDIKPGRYKQLLTDKHLTVSPNGVVYKGNNLKRVGRKLRILAGGLLLCGLVAQADAQEAAQTPPPNCSPSGPSELAKAAPPPAVQPSAAVEKNRVPGETPVGQRPYERLTTGQKFTVFVKQIYSPYTLGTVAFNALQAQASGSWYMYGGGMEGYGKRYGASLANQESGVFFGWFLYPTLFHQDPRYPYRGTGGFFDRAGYAMSRVLITRGDSGRQQFNYSHVSATFTAAGLANTYYPRNLRTFGNTMGNAGMGLVSDAGMNLLREFWPDMRKKFRKHAPERIKRLEENPSVAKIERAIEGVPNSPPEKPCPPTASSAATGDQSGRP